METANEIIKSLTPIVVAVIGAYATIKVSNNNKKEKPKGK